MVIMISWFLVPLNDFFHETVCLHPAASGARTSEPPRSALSTAYSTVSFPHSFLASYINAHSDRLSPCGGPFVPGMIHIGMELVKANT